MTTLRQEQVDAAQAFANAAIEALRTERGVHAETAVTGVARMAGSFLFQSFGFAQLDAQPGQPVVSEQANERGAQLVQLLGGVLGEIGMVLDPERLGGDGRANEPQQDLLSTQQLLAPAFAEIRGRHGLSLPEASDAAVVATAFLMHQCAAVLDPHVAFGLAVYGFAEGSKTMPAGVAL
jgi:hypothetical protein